MTKSYPVVLYQVRENGNSGYSVFVPDFPGCISAGSTMQDALENTREALDLHLQALIEGGETIAEPSTVDQVREKSDPEAIYGVVDVQLSEIQEKALARKSTRINVTFPGDLLHEIDDYCEQNGLARSRFFQLLAERFLRKTIITDEFERTESVLRGTRTALPKGPIERQPGWDKIRSAFESALRVPYCEVADLFAQRDSMANSPPEARSQMLFNFFLLNAVWALESSWFSERIRREDPNRTPALDPTK